MRNDKLELGQTIHKQIEKSLDQLELKRDAERFRALERGTKVGFNECWTWFRTRNGAEETQAWIGLEAFDEIEFSDFADKCIKAFPDPAGDPE